MYNKPPAWPSPQAYDRRILAPVRGGPAGPVPERLRFVGPSAPLSAGQCTEPGACSP